MLLEELAADDDWRLRGSQTEQFAGLFKTLGDPIRLKILSLVAASREPIAAADLLPHVGVSQPTVSHHVRALVQAGLMRSKRQGVFNKLEVADDKFQEIARLLAPQRGRSKKAR